MKDMKGKSQHLSILLVLLLFLSSIPFTISAVEIPELNTQSIQKNLPTPEDITMNSPPNPPVITGPTSGNIDVYYSYNFTITDPDEDIMFNLEINWGDGTESLDCGCDKSWQNGTVVTATHRWKKQNSYGITARVSDSMGQYSNWSESLIVSMPKQKTTLQFNIFLKLLQHFVAAKQITRLTDIL